MGDRRARTVLGICGAVMKKLILSCAVLVACGGSTREPALPRLSTFVGEALVVAIAHHDLPAITASFQVPVSFGGLWFTDPECARQFPTQTKIQADRLPAFAQCIATLPLQSTGRRHQLGDIEVLEYPPGIEVEIQFVARGEHAWITWIGYAGRRDPKDALPTITGTALDGIRTGPATVAMDDTTRQMLDAGAKDLGLDAQYAWLKICLDTTGAVTGVHAREITSPLAERVFVDAARAWQFKPFQIGDQVLPVCAMERVSASQISDKEILPIELAPDEGDVPRIAPAGVKRISGEKMITPSDHDKTRIQLSGVERIVAAFKVCIDGNGAVQRVVTLRPSGLDSYDQKIEAGIRTWKYKPVLRDGKPIEACTAVTFIYSQR